MLGSRPMSVRSSITLGCKEGWVGYGREEGTDKLLGLRAIVRTFDASLTKRSGARRRLLYHPANIEHFGRLPLQATLDMSVFFFFSSSEYSSSYPSSETARSASLSLFCSHLRRRQRQPLGREAFDVTPARSAPLLSSMPLRPPILTANSQKLLPEEQGERLHSLRTRISTATHTPVISPSATAAPAAPTPSPSPHHRNSHYHYHHRCCCCCTVP